MKPRNLSHVLNAELVYQLRVEFWINKKPIYLMSRELDVTYETIRNAVYGYRWKNVPMPVIIVRNKDHQYGSYGNGDLTKDEVLSIRNRFASGDSIRDLAMEFNTSYDVVQKVVYGITYRRYGGPMSIREYNKKQGVVC